MADRHKKQRVYVGVGATLALVGAACLSIAIWYLVINLTAGNDAARNTIGAEELVFNFGQAAPISVEPDNDLAALAGAYPGRFVNPKYWSAAHNLGNEPFGITGINPDEYTLVDADKGIYPELDAGAETQATRIRAPAINLDSAVQDLLVQTGADGVQRYDSPNGFVGFIPETGTPDDARSGWYFGHLESLGEGNVFRRLPQVVDLARNDPVDFFVATDTHEFVYRVSATYDIHRDDLQTGFSERTSQDGNSQMGFVNNTLQEDDYAIYLCTCWPPRNYTRRVIVKAELIAFKDLGAA